MRKHVAYNPTTGEVLECNSGNQLKRWVARTNRWDLANGYGRNRWIYAHGKDAYQALATRNN